MASVLKISDGVLVNKTEESKYYKMANEKELLMKEMI